MSQFIEKLFSFKEAYSFGKPPRKPLKKRLFEEMEFQLRDLETHWVELMKCGPNRNLDEEFAYQRHLERIYFRLEEIHRFLKTNNGPRIIRYICSEIQDLLDEHRLTKRPLPKELMEYAEVILAVMNSFFQPEVSVLHLTTTEEMSKQLKEMVENLLNRYSGKNREESLKSLTNLGKE